MAFTISKYVAQKVIQHSREASECLTRNMQIMERQINSQFIGLKDPAFISYLELSMQMQELLKQTCGKMEAVSDYCQKVINWIDQYNNM